MYIIIKRDKAEHLKEKLHHIKAAAMEILECMEEAYSKHHEYDSEYHPDMARRSMTRDEDPYYKEGYDRDDARYMARRGRGRY